MTIGMKAFLLLAIIAANLPFLSAKLFFVFSIAPKKFFWLTLTEFIVYFFLVGMLARFLEIQSYGAVYKQGIVFYIISLILFVIFAFTGFVLRYSKISKI